ncbi:hypothetical protein SLEP1_g2014 [Rubroshorea leprosula]|uniref:Uncharacterized protein n=1 Tax=Rubroshorea leprosula TaxID=152421 RepID=A0AAV5HQ96_9ROSI|nr:hypothetical protein SLEP1_g2014 [Rubroshorea leprosula]
MGECLPSTPVCCRDWTNSSPEMNSWERRRLREGLGLHSCQDLYQWLFVIYREFFAQVLYIHNLEFYACRDHQMDLNSMLQS